MVVIVGIDPTCQAYETRAYPSMLYHHIETHCPHEYPAYLQLRPTVVAVSAMCFYMVEAQGLEP